MKEVRDIFVSLVVVIDPQSKEQLRSRLEAWTDILTRHYAHHEILLLDGNFPGMPDVEVTEVLGAVQKVRYQRVQGAASREVVLAAGLESAIGDIIVTFDAELVSEKNVVDSVEKCCEGNDVVCGVAKSRRPLAYSLGSWFFRTFFGKMVGYDLPRDDTWSRCLSRRVINAAIESINFHPFVFLRLVHAAGRYATVPVEIPPTWRKRYQFGCAIRKAITIIVFNTVQPMRVINMLALGVSGLSVLAAAYTIVMQVVRNDVVPGWTTLMLFLSGMFFCLFAVLAFLGEYLVRVVVENHNLRPYSVTYEKHSSVMLDLNELNIRESSVSEKINRTQTGRDR